MTTTPNDAPPQGDSPPDDPAGQTDPTSDDAAVTPASEPPDDDQDDDNLTQEAKRYRLRLREVEGERDGLRSQLDAMRSAQIADAVHDAGYSARLVDLIDAAAVLDDAGAIDGDKLSEAITVTVRDFGMSIAPRPPRPVPGQGTGSGGTHGNTSWSAALGGN